MRSCALHVVLLHATSQRHIEMQGGDRLYEQRTGVDTGNG